MVEIRCHPCATALGGAAEVVAVEQGDGLARGIGDLKGLALELSGAAELCDKDNHIFPKEQLNVLKLNGVSETTLSS